MYQGWRETRNKLHQRYFPKAHPYIHTDPLNVDSQTIKIRAPYPATLSAHEQHEKTPNVYPKLRRKAVYEEKKKKPPYFHKIAKNTSPQGQRLRFLFSPSSFHSNSTLFFFSLSE